MQKLKYNYEIDLYTNKKFDINYYRNKLKTQRKQLRPKSCGVYLSEVAALYYKEVYNEKYENVLAKFFNIPKCPVTQKPVVVKLGGSISFGKFSSECSRRDMNEWIENNNPNKIAQTKRLKIERKGEGNPSFGKKAWNNGLTLEHPKIKQAIEKKNKTVDNLTFEEKEKWRKKQSESAKKRLIQGHTGCLHSEETKEKIRQKTIQRIKEKRFPQTDTLPCRLFKELLLNLNINYEEEFKIKFWSFDFKIGNNLIEIQGDYWHSNPKKYLNGPVTKGQKVNFFRDIKKRKFIKEETNYKLIEFWEYDIINNKKEVELCLKKLLV